MGKVYNVVQAQPVPADVVFERMQQSGHIQERVSLGEWRTRLQQAAEQEGDLELEMLARSLWSVEGISKTPASMT